MPGQNTTSLTTESQTAEYYAALGQDNWAEKFENYDDESVYRRLNQKAEEAVSRNFMIDFGDQAWCAFDVRAEAWHKLLNSDRPKSFDTRWINIWGPHRQTDLVKILAKKYSFSPRLTGIMCSIPHQRIRKIVQEHQTTANTSTASPTSPLARFKPRFSLDVEKATPSSAHTTQAESVDFLQGLNHYDIVDSIWHWSSVDLGEKYICLGYNSLYNVKITTGEGQKRSSKHDLPNGERVWTWLILGYDKTVITIIEDHSDTIDAVTNGSASVVPLRRNLLNVFGQLSTKDDRNKRNPISIVPIRSDVHGGIDIPPTATQTDRPGLLFYYLFDDWYQTYALLAKQEHQYGVELNKLRHEMMETAKLEHVEDLHHIGRQLAVLKRLYQSYELLIDRVIEKRKIVPEGTDGSFSQPIPTFGAPNNAPNGDAYEQLGVYLTSAVRVRFERLRDRIRLYALSEIQECVDLKDSLVMMNFNLITIKESDSVERLTRITILLAKVTILFLPISLMTAYFSVQISDTHFTLHAYWIAFAVVLVLSFLLIWIFGKLSGTVEGKMVYRPLNKVMLDMWRSLRNKRKEN